MKVSRRTILGASIALAQMHTSRSAEAGDPAEGLLDRIAKARAAVRTLRGPFTQRRTIGLLATEVRSQGTMVLVRPDRLRWQLEPPDDVTFWIGPDGLAYRSAHGHGSMPEAGVRVAAALDDLRTLLGGDLGKLAERWSIRTLRDDANGAEIEAAARDPRAMNLRTIQFALAADLVRPTKALLVETERDRTTIEFGPLAVNEPVADATMKPS